MPPVSYTHLDVYKRQVLGPGGDVRFGPRLREAVCSQFIMSLLHEQYRENPTPFVNYYIA